MASITFLPDKRKVTVTHDETILGAAQRAGIPLTHVCQGNARCSTCRVRIVEGIENVSHRSGEEQDIADKMDFGADIRLACQTKVTGDVKVRRLVLDEEDIELTSLLISDSTPNAAGVEKEVLILFADIRGFTSLAENILPYDVVHILNRYFLLMNNVINRHGGLINNYMGDAFLALFEVKANEKDVLRGIRAGLEMLDVVDKRIQPYIQNFFGRDFSIGIGLHYGLVVAGTIGAPQNNRRTIIGDAVNFASRLESINRKLGTQFLISEDIYAIVHNSIRVNRTHTVNIRGKAGSHTVYEVVGLI